MVRLYLYKDGFRQINDPVLFLKQIEMKVLLIVPSLLFAEEIWGGNESLRMTINPQEERWCYILVGQMDTM